MNFLWIALAAPLIWAFSAHIDKYLLSNYFRNKTRALVLFSCFIGVFVLPFAYFFEPNIFAVGPLTILFMIINGIIYLSYIFPYLEAMKHEEVSVTIPIFQTIPVFVGILAFLLLGEVLSLQQVAAAALVIIGAIGISLKFGAKKPVLKKKVLGLMLLSSFLLALNAVLFKVFAIQDNFWVTVFWQEVGFVILGIFLLSISKKYRKEFVDSFKTNPGFVIGANFFNEAINIIAVMIFNFSALLVPITLIWLLNGVTPFFVVVIGIVITLFFPKMSAEDISRKALLQKVFFIALLFIGVYLLNA